MKKISILAVFLLLSASVFAQSVTFRTGDSFGLSNTDFFIPSDITFMASRCTVTAIKKIDNDYWCLRLTAPKSVNTNAPIEFEYYLKKGDVLYMHRLLNPMEEIPLKVSSIGWNKITVEIP